MYFLSDSLIFLLFLCKSIFSGNCITLTFSDETKKTKPLCIESDSALFANKRIKCFACRVRDRTGRLYFGNKLCIVALSVPKTKSAAETRAPPKTLFIIFRVPRIQVINNRYQKYSSRFALTHMTAPQNTYRKSCQSILQIIFSPIIVLKLHKTGTHNLIKYFSGFHAEVLFCKL